MCRVPGRIFENFRASGRTNFKLFSAALLLQITGYQSEYSRIFGWRAEKMHINLWNTAFESFRIPRWIFEIFRCAGREISNRHFSANSRAWGECSENFRTAGRKNLNCNCYTNFRARGRTSAGREFQVNICNFLDASFGTCASSWRKIHQKSQFRCARQITIFIII